MRRIRQTVLMLTGLALGGASAASAQSAFSASETRIGPVLGLGGLGGAGMSIGGRFEKAIKQLPNLGDGVLSFQVSVDYYSYNDNFGLGTDWSFRYIPFSGTVNYHINLKNEKADVFVGAGLGYLSVSTSYSGLGSYSGSGIYFVGRLGGSYDIAKVLALYADVGAGAATLNAGVMINIGGK